MELNQNVLFQFLKGKYPNSQIEFVGGCWSSIAFSVDDFIFRFPKKEIEPYIKETKILPYIRNKITFAIPDVRIEDGFEFPYAYHKIIKGKRWTLNDLSFATKREYDALAYDCALFFFQIHQVSTSEIRNLVPNIKSQRYINSVNKDELWNILKEYISINQFDTLYSNYQNAAVLKTENLIFSHGDFSGSNSLINENYKLIGVFDWASAGIEEREYEFFRFFDGDNHFLNKVISYYEEMSKIRINKSRIKEIFLLDNIHILYAIHTREHLFSTRKDRMGWLLDNLKMFY